MEGKERMGREMGGKRSGGRWGDDGKAGVRAGERPPPAFARVIVVIIVHVVMVVFVIFIVLAVVVLFFLVAMFCPCCRHSSRHLGTEEVAAEWPPTLPVLPTAIALHRNSRPLAAE